MSRQELSRYISEFVGTFILVASIKLSDNKPDFAAFTISITLMMVVYNFGYISLAMFNPAVTLAQILRDSDNFRRNNVSMWISYLLMQFTGGIAGGFFGSIIGGKQICRMHTSIANDASLGQAFLGEFFFTAILCSLNLHLATDKRVDGNQFYGISIAACLFVSINCIGIISGSALNPAVWVGTVSSAAFCGHVHFENSWVYWLAHLLAGWTSGVWFLFFYGGEACFGEAETDESFVETKRKRRSTSGVDSYLNGGSLSVDEESTTYTIEDSVHEDIPIIPSKPTIVSVDEKKPAWRI